MRRTLLGKKKRHGEINKGKSEGPRAGFGPCAHTNELWKEKKFFLFVCIQMPRIPDPIETKLLLQHPFPIRHTSAAAQSILESYK